MVSSLVGPVGHVALLVLVPPLGNRWETCNIDSFRISTWVPRCLRCGAGGVLDVLGGVCVWANGFPGAADQQTVLDRPACCRCAYLYVNVGTHMYLILGSKRFAYFSSMS